MHCQKLATACIAAIITTAVRLTSQSFALVIAVLLSLSACGTAEKVTEDNLLSEFPATDNEFPKADNEYPTTDNLGVEPSVSAELDDSPTLKSVKITDFLAPADPTQDTGPEPLNITLATWRAERGHVESQVALGLAYASGTPRVEKDMQQAKLWFELASLKGDSRAQYELGKLFYTGQGTDKDYFNAREWWIESALKGNLDAQQRLGYLYSEGLGVERDFEKAKFWYSKAAREGHAEAQTLLGSLYHEGNRIPTDYSEAFKWYKLAAEQGHPHAQYTLATLYHDGLGTQVDYIQCAAWVDVAIANGFDDEYQAKANCRSNLDELSNRTATHLADVWKKRYLTTGI